MDISAVDIASYSTQKALSDTAQKADVKLLKGAGDQLETVMTTLLTGIDVSARAVEQTGQKLNLKA